MSLSNTEAKAAPAAALNDWKTLADQWHTLGRQWAQWWAHAAASLPSLRHMAPEIGNSGLELPLPPSAWIDPAAAAAITERYNRKLEALWISALQGRSAPQLEHRDRRFAAKEWREQPYFALLRDSYLLYSDYLSELANVAQGDEAAKDKLKFLVRQYLDAIAPSNFFATNPEAMKLALDSGGASVAQGLSNLLADAQRGRIAMTDESAFGVGVNLAITPGSVVFRNQLIELIQYSPTTEEVFQRPLVMIPPCINKYYILDLQPNNSFVRYAVEQGHTVFMVSWRNISPDLGRLTWDDYLETGVLAAIECAREITATTTVNVLGFCVGGTLLACALAVLAGRGDVDIASATLLTTMLDFADPGEIGVYV